MPISGFKHDLYLRSPCRSCYWNYHWKVDFLKKKKIKIIIHMEKSTQANPSKKWIKSGFLNSNSRWKKKIQNPCSLYQNVKELRKKKKIQNLQDCCRLRIEKRKPHNPLSHCVFKMSFMQTFIRGNKKLKISIFDKSWPQNWLLFWVFEFI